MALLSKIKNKIRKAVGVGQEPVVFYTKDYFVGRKFIVGDYTYGKPRVLFEYPHTNLHIGKFSSIAEDVTIFLGGNHRPDFNTTYPFNTVPVEEFGVFRDLKGHPASKGSVYIGNDVWIGYRSIIMSGVQIADGAVIGAGSVVSKNVGPYEIWAGNPARFIKKRFSDEKIEKLLELKWWDWDMEKIKNNIPALMSTENLP